MLSNCIMSKTRAITKICDCAELTDTLNTWRKKIIMIIIILCYFEILTSCQGSMLTFSKHYAKGKTVLVKLRKTLQERRLLILKFSQDNPQLLRDYWNLPKDQHLLLWNHTLLTQKQIFHRELIKKSFPLKCSLNVPWMS